MGTNKIAYTYLTRQQEILSFCDIQSKFYTDQYIFPLNQNAVNLN